MGGSSMSRARARRPPAPRVPVEAETPRATPAAGGRGRAATALVCASIALAVALAFGRVLGHGFLNFDDDVYVHANPLVLGGITPRGVAQAFVTVHSFTWHPLTTLSHMLDVELFGLDPGRHHATSLVLHAATAVLLFLVLRRMTGAFACSAFAALLFAVHPLRVESVAWLSERKDVLSGLFFVLTLGAWTRWVRSPTAGRYAVALLCFVLALLSKPMVVTLPFVLLLLDRWPFDRLGDAGRPLRHLGPRALEKLPFLVLALADGAVAMTTQEGAMTATDTVGFGSRLANALVAYAVYLRQSFVPVDLGILYPYVREGFPVLTVALAGLLLAAITAGALLARRRCPALLVGWLWFAGMLVPVIGIVQIGVHAWADRYTYLPHVGLAIALVWSVAAWWPRALDRRIAVALGALAAVALVVAARAQTAHWRTSEALWRHTLASTPRNSVAHAQLGVALADAGRADEAVEHYRKALAIQPDYPTPLYNLGNALAARGDLEGAIAQYRLAVRARPDYAKAHNNLGAALAARRRTDEALEAFRAALAIDPGYVEARLNLAAALEQAGRTDEARAEYRRVLQTQPGNADAQARLRALGATPG